MSKKLKKISTDAGKPSKSTSANKPTASKTEVPASSSAPAPLDLGVTLVLVIGGQDLVIHARTALEYDAAHGKSRCGITMPEDCQVIALHAGGARAAEQARNYAAMSGKHYDVTNPEIQAIGTHQSFNWCSVEGVAALQPYMTEHEDALITITQRLKTPMPPEFAQVVTKMDAIARAAAARVLLFVSIAHRRDVDALNSVSCECIEIDACEPGPGATIAFSIMFSGLDLLYPLGLGPKMCEIHLDDGRYKREFTTFIATTLEDRLIWMARAKGKSLEQIAELLRLGHRSTVLRRLQTLRQPDADEVPSGWIKQAIEMLGLEPDVMKDARREQPDPAGNPA